MIKVTLLADHAHDDGGTPPLIANDFVGNPEWNGQYGGNVMGVRKDCDHPILVGLHELGHHISTHVLDASALKRITDVAQNTWAWEMIRTHASKEKLSYWTDPEEIFSRAYSQWVAMRTGNPEAHAELRGLLNDPKKGFAQWQPWDFTRVAKAVEIELRRIGWLK